MKTDTNNDLFSITKNFIFEAAKIEIKNTVKNHESNNYGAYTGELLGKNVTFRTAKSTPKKLGYFVALWKRKNEGEIAPYSLKDPQDLFIISVKNDSLFGLFIFPKKVLLKHNILSSKEKEGKRGFRLYASWNTVNNPQAAKTQSWQTAYFFQTNLSKTLYEKEIEKLKKLLS